MALLLVVRAGETVLGFYKLPLQSLQPLLLLFSLSLGLLFYPFSHSGDEGGRDVTEWIYYIYTFIYKMSLMNVLVHTVIILLERCAMRTTSI